MGRSRITRTFHNKPKTKRIPTPQTTKHVSGSNNRSEEPQRQTYNTPSAHAAESSEKWHADLLRDDLTFKESPSEHKERTEGNYVTSNPSPYGRDQYGNANPKPKSDYEGYSPGLKKSKSVGKIKRNPKANSTKLVRKGKKGKQKGTKRGSPKPLDNFAQGVGNNIHNIFGVATGTNQGTKSVLNKAAGQALAGDWGSAGNTIANNPYKFAGNMVGGGGISVLGNVAYGVATNVGNTLFPANRAYGSPGPTTPKKEVLKERVKSKGERLQEYYAQKAKEAKEKEDSLFGGYGQFL